MRMSLKLYVSFAKETCKRDDILQKRRMISPQRTEVEGDAPSQDRREASYRGDTGWRRLVGSLKLQVSCAKETYKRDDILQKRPVISEVIPRTDLDTDSPRREGRPSLDENADDALNYCFFLQNIVSFTGLFCKRDL